MQFKIQENQIKIWHVDAKANVCWQSTEEFNLKVQPYKKYIAHI